VGAVAAHARAHIHTAPNMNNELAPPEIILPEFRKFPLDNAQKAPSPKRLRRCTLPAEWLGLMTCLSSHGALLRSPGSASMRAAAPAASSGATPHHRSLPARGPVRVCAALPQSVLSLKDVKVSDAMKSPPTTVSPDTSVFDVLEVRAVPTHVSGTRIHDLLT
jgi:CBS domain-containing protein